MPALDALLSRLCQSLASKALPGFLDAARGLFEEVYWAGFREGLLLGLAASMATFLLLRDRK